MKARIKALGKRLGPTVPRWFPDLRERYRLWLSVHPGHDYEQVLETGDIHILEPSDEKDRQADINLQDLLRRYADFFGHHGPLPPYNRPVPTAEMMAEDDDEINELRKHYGPVFESLTESESTNQIID